MTMLRDMLFYTIDYTVKTLNREEDHAGELSHYSGPTLKTRQLKLIAPRHDPGHAFLRAAVKHRVDKRGENALTIISIDEGQQIDGAVNFEGA